VDYRRKAEYLVSCTGASLAARLVRDGADLVDVGERSGEYRRGGVRGCGQTADGSARRDLLQDHVLPVQPDHGARLGLPHVPVDVPLQDQRVEQQRHGGVSRAARGQARTRSTLLADSVRRGHLHQGRGGAVSQHLQDAVSQQHAPDHQE
jgi:hypothetical protein